MVIFIVLCILIASILFILFIYNLKAYYISKKKSNLHNTTVIDIKFNEKIPYE